MLLIKGVHPKVVSGLLGHANISITLDTYSHVPPGLGDTVALAMEDALKQYRRPRGCSVDLVTSDRLRHESPRLEWRAGWCLAATPPRLLPQCCKTLTETLLGCHHPVTQSS